MSIKNLINLAQQAQNETSANVTSDAGLDEPSDTDGMVSSTDFLAIQYANIIIFAAAIIALIWAFVCYKLVQRVEMKSESI